MCVCVCVCVCVSLCVPTSVLCVQERHQGIRARVRVYSAGSKDCGVLTCGHDMARVTRWSPTHAARWEAMSSDTTR